jgi:hypothetical protein
MSCHYKLERLAAFSGVSFLVMNHLQMTQKRTDRESVGSSDCRQKAAE